MYIKNILFPFVLFILFSSCATEEDIVFTNIPLHNSQLIDLGKIKIDKNFSLKKDNSFYYCEFNVKTIKKNDTIYSLKLEQQGHKLTFNITTSPNDFDCIDDTCFTAHKVSFYIEHEFQKGLYDVEVYINNGLNQDYQFQYYIN